PAATLATYYAGTIPFVLGFLYFFADMSRSPFARGHLAEASLAIGALFVWMKYCQARFAQRMRAQLATEADETWTWNRTLRVFVVQAVVQPTGLFVLPLAAIIAFPFGWTYAFYQTVTALADTNI